MQEPRSGVLARIIGVVMVLILVFAGVRYLGRRRNQSTAMPSPVVTSALKSEEEKKIEETTKLSVPESGDKAVLKSITSLEGTAIANRVKKGSGYEITVTANLPEPPAGAHYEAWLAKDDETVGMGRLALAKGGYLLEKQVSFDASSYGRVVVSEEKKEDAVMEKDVLEGNF